MEPAAEPDTQRDTPATPLVVLTLEAESKPIPLPMVTFSIPVTAQKTEGEKPKKSINRQERKVQTGNPGSKRHTRYVNAVNLDPYYSTASDSETEGELDDLVQVTPSPYESLRENPPLWDEWRNITEEKQKALLAPAADTRANPENSDTDDEREANKPCIPKSISIPLTKYIGSAFLQNIEKEMKAFACAITAYNLVAAHESELYTIRVSSSTSLVLTFKDSYHRLLFHGICTYFRLSSVSRWSETGERLTIVRRPRVSSPLPEESIEQYLLRRQKRH